MWESKLEPEANCTKFRKRIKALSKSVLVSSEYNFSQQYEMIPKVLNTWAYNDYRENKGKKRAPFCLEWDCDILFQ